ncbi:tyrosine-protein phosphatase non-receptor type 20 [Pteronotus mesoamericanus]|uniref:tyrosine-protein phosphatase non-receptor type 20 n=1 Tax=Pteronotus mesoamericanus TaxID=1884717 RepID=UPI0023EB4D94|nr:tyrosine-protein phosphatase non-receptor type 20 [Pteronotus parnellii mesoamericanus]
MSSPRKAATESGKDQKRDDSNMEDLNFFKTLPSSSQRKTPRSVVANEVNSEKIKLSLQNIQHSDSEDFFKEAAQSESEHSMWTASGSFLRDKYSSEDELAGPSQTVSSHLHDSIQIVSERELAQLARVQPLIFSSHEQSAIKDCYKILQKKIEEREVIREFMTGVSHFIKQLQFTNWPDHSTPASVDGFIKYVRFVRKSHLTGPIIVHCSAGVGRTGVFLCVDVVFCAIEKNFSFNIRNIVAQMREQRCGMVQTKEQYYFCYKIVLEVLQKLVTFH